MVTNSLLLQKALGPQESDRERDCETKKILPVDKLYKRPSHNDNVVCENLHLPLKITTIVIATAEDKHEGAAIHRRQVSQRISHLWYMRIPDS